MANKQKIVLLLDGDAKGAIKATQLTGKGLDNVTEKGKRASSQFSDIAAKGAKWGAVAAGAAAAGAAVLIKQQLDLIDNTAKTSDKLGIATEKLTAMRVQAELTGVAQGTLDKGLQQMIKGVGDAAEGTGVAADALEKLNLKAGDLKSLSPDQQFYAIADAMEEVKNNTDKVSIAYDIFGAKGTALINTLRGGSAAALDAQKFTDQWGLAISRVDASKVEQANDAMTLLGQASQGFWKQLTVNVSPAITGLSNEMLGVGEGFGTASDMADKAFNAMVAGAALVADMGRVIQIAFKGATVIVAQWFAGVWDAIAGADRLLTDLLNKLPEFMGGGSFEASDFLQNVSGALRNTATELGEELTDLLERPLASTAWPQKIKEWEAAATEAGEKAAKAADMTAAANANLSNGIRELTEEEKKLIAEREKQAALNAALLGDAEYQVSLLTRELDANNKGADALAAFNREKVIEAALRSESAQKLLPAELEKYEELIGAQYDLSDAVAKKTEADKAAAEELKKLQDQADPYAQAWVAAIERVDSAFSDVFYDLFDGALDSFDDFADSMLDSFKRLLAEMAYEATLRPVVVGIQQSVTGGLTGGGTGTGSITELLGMIGGSSAGGGAGSYGGMAGGGASVLAGAGSSAVGASSYAGMAGEGTSVLAGGSAAPSGMLAGIYTAGFAAAVAYGAQSFVNAANDVAKGNANKFDYLDLAFPGLGSAAESIKNAISGSGTKVKGYGVNLGVSAGDLSGGSYIDKKKDRGYKSTRHWTDNSDLSDDLDAMLSAQLDTSMSVIKSAFGSLGADVTDSMVDSFESAASRISFSGASEEEIQQRLAEWLDSVATEFSDHIGDQLGGALGDFELPQLLELSGGLSVVNSVLAQTGEAAMDVSLNGALAAKGLIDAAGGLENFIAIAQASYQFDTALGLKDGLDPLRAALSNVGITIAQVEGAAEGGTGAIAQLFAGLTDAQKAGLNPFVSQILALTPALEASTEIAEEATRAEQDLAAERERIASERYGLETELLQLQGDEAALLARRRAEISESNLDIFDQIEMLKVEQAAKAESARVAEEAAASVLQAEQDLAAERERIASERYGLETELLQLMGDEAALLARRRAEISESNLDIFDQIEALKAEQAAKAESARVAEEAAASVLQAEQDLAAERERIASERYGLETELLQLMGDEAALLARRRAEISESNLDIFDQIEALKAEQAAKAESARVAEEAAASVLQAEQDLAAERERIASERYGLETELLQLQGDEAALLARRRAEISESNLDIFDHIEALKVEQATKAESARVAEEAAASVLQAEQDLAAERERIASERYGLESELLQLMGDEAALLARRRAEISESNLDIFDQIEALKAEQAAKAESARVAEEAANVAAEAAQSVLQAEQDLAAERERIASERYGLETELLQLQGDEAALLARRRAEISESNLDIFDHIEALKVEQAAKAESARVAEEAANVASQAAQSVLQAEQELAAERERIASERYGLESELLQLMGDEAALLARRRAEISESNLDIFDQIEALKAEQAAKEKTTAAAIDAASAAETLSAALAAAGDAIADEILRLRGLASGSTANLAALQTQFAIATAQARAGSVDALSELPQLSKALESALSNGAMSSFELRRDQARLAGSLSETLGAVGLPQPASSPALNGGNATLAMQPAFVPASSSSAPEIRNLLAEISRLNKAVDGLRADQRAQAKATLDVQVDALRLQKRWDFDGLPETRTL